MNDLWYQKSNYSCPNAGPDAMALQLLNTMLGPQNEVPGQGTAGGAPGGPNGSGANGN